MRLRNRAYSIEEAVTRHLVSDVFLLALSAGIFASGEDTSPEPAAQGAGWSGIAARTVEDSCGSEGSAGVGGRGTGSVVAFGVQP